MTTVAVSLISSAASILCVIITSIMSNRKIEQQLMTNQAVTDVKIENLTTELRKQNTFGDRITKLETKVEILEKGAK